jgi:RNA polymerase sigma-70 factor, ECF subfamily
METSEKQLVQHARLGDRIAQATIVHQHERMVYNLALRLLGNSEEADCVLQETFVKVLQALSSFNENSQLSTWIYRIATNEALMLLRKRKRQYATFESSDDIQLKDYSDLNQSLTTTPLDELLNEELKEKMNEAIEQLSPKYKSVFILKDIEGVSLKEISEMLDLSLPAVKSNLHRARLFLRDKLAEYFDGRK